MIVISPAKKMNCKSSGRYFTEYTEPLFFKKTIRLIESLRSLERKEIQTLMKISEKLSFLNFDRYKTFSYNQNFENSKQSIFAFLGDTYKGLKVSEFSKDDLKYSQKRLRILSGLYGLLRPLDLIQEHRLEMGTSNFSNLDQNLYSFWSSTLTNQINKEILLNKSTFLINLASNEYFKVINSNQINCRILTPMFFSKKDGKILNIGILSKKARGMMTSYLLKNKYDSIEQIKNFSDDGYKYDSIDSEKNYINFIK